MALNLESLRALGAKQHVLFNAQTQTFESAGAKHALRIFFKKPDAVARNRATLEAIRQAIVADSRYETVKDQAEEMLNSVHANQKISAATIRTMFQKLEQLKTPEAQRKLLKDRFMMRLASQGVPSGWAKQVHRIGVYIERHLPGIIRNAKGNPHQVDVPKEIRAIEDKLNRITSACIDDQRGLNQEAFEVMAHVFTNRPQDLATQKDVNKFAGNVRAALAEAHKVAREKQPQYDVVKLAISFMETINGVPKEHVFEHLQKTVEDTLADQPLRNQLASQTGSIATQLNNTLQKLFSVANNRFTYPEGVMLDPYEKQAAINFIFTGVAKSLTRVEQERLFEQLTSKEGRNLRLAYEDIGAESRACANAISVYDAMTKVLAEVLGRSVKPLDTENDRADMERVPVAVRAEGACCFCGPLKVNGAVAALAVQLANGEDAKAERFFRYLGQVVKGGRRLADLTRELTNPASLERRIMEYPTLSATPAANRQAQQLLMKFDEVFARDTIEKPWNAADYKALMERLVLENLNRKKSLPSVEKFEQRLLANQALWNNALHLLDYPALCEPASDARAAIDMLMKFDAFYAKIDARNEKEAFCPEFAPPSYKSIVERFIFEDLAHTKATTGRLPKAADFVKQLPNNVWVDYARWGVKAVYVHSLVRMPVAYREPIIKSMKAFYNSTDYVLFSNLVHKREAILQLAQRNELTREQIFRLIRGAEAPIPTYFIGETEESKRKTAIYFDTENYNTVIQALEEHHLMHLFTPAITLSTTYAITTDELLHLLTTPNAPRPDGARKFNCYEPVVFQAIVEDEVEGAVEQLLMDIHRYVDGYKVNGREATVEPASYFTFQLPNGTMPVYSSKIDETMTEDEQRAYNDGHPSPVSNRITDAVTNLCGKMQKRQIANVLLTLSQAGLAPLRNDSSIFGVKATEHSPVKYNIARLENGDVTVCVSNPDNCPLKFDWTYTIRPNGDVTMGEVNMCLAEAVVEDVEG